MMARVLEALPWFFMAWFVSWGITRFLLSVPIAARLLDKPNARSLHDIPKPRTGGLAILSAIVLVLFIFWSNNPFPVQGLPFLVALLMVAGISLADDFLGHIAAHYRLLVQFAASVPLVVAFPLFLPPLLSVPVSLLFAVWMINLYNFMDGMDGFAGGMGCIGFAFLGLMGREDPQFMVLAFVLSGANLGFLMFNFPPSRLFMGDVGSASMGFAAATLIFWGSWAGLFTFWTAVLVFSPFFADATITLLRRMIRKERFWEAHRSHYYQRLVQIGWGHRKTVLVEYGFMLMAGASALWQDAHAGIHFLVTLLIVWALVYTFFFWMIEYMERSR